MGQASTYDFVGDTVQAVLSDLIGEQCWQSDEEKGDIRQGSIDCGELR